MQVLEMRNEYLELDQRRSSFATLKGFLHLIGIFLYHGWIFYLSTLDLTSEQTEKVTPAFVKFEIGQFYINLCSFMIPVILSRFSNSFLDENSQIRVSSLLPIKEQLEKAYDLKIGGH